MTATVLAAAGVTVQTPEPNRWQVLPGPITAEDTAIEPDLSNAGPYLAAAVVTGGRVTVPYWPVETTQIGDRWRDILPELGDKVALEPVAVQNYTNLSVNGMLDAEDTPI